MKRRTELRSFESDDAACLQDNLQSVANDMAGQRLKALLLMPLNA